ncbi:helix-turn-helix domain-containing protein [Pedobacter africanus]|uniref:Cro/C1-type HTH DNA-binding domain-containing protein n=1 Tax=Pedobacter africanus TaxID=151894 RepID=A0A1W1ZD61_9SPHI|nr:helix-turn-helix transcriptional regulator [Pedobacter africanus]SMC46353.1 Cro/C1-type HTH DNA-binding domain-containing protein [Pedobacter africanus]
MTPGEKLKIILDKADWTAADLAREAKITRMSASRMVRDMQDLNFEVMMVLRKKLKVNINQFFDS